MKKEKIFMRLNTHSTLFIFSILVAVAFSGCATLKLRLYYDDQTGWFMFGKTPQHTFSDTSHFTFPLEELWSYDVGAGFGYASPILVDSILVTGTLQGEVHAIHAVTGKKIGYIKTFSPISSSLALSPERLFIGMESGEKNFIAYDTKNNENFWTKDVGGVTASPIVNDSLIYICGLNGKLYCYEERYGTELWNFDTKYEIRSTPALSESAIFVANTKGTMYSLNAVTGTILWKYQTPLSLTAGLLYADGMVIAGSRDSSVYILDAVKGTLLYRISVGDKVVATPSVQNGFLYISTLSGNIFSVEIQSEKVLWKFSAKSAVNTTPFVTPSAIFVTSLDGNIYALSPNDGSILWQHTFENRIKTTPLVWQNKIYIATEDRDVYCFGEKSSQE